MREYIFVFNLDAIVQDKSGEKNCGILEFINDNAQRCYFKQDCIDKNREKTVVAIGNSESDIAMMEKADIRIGYGGIKEVMPEILSTVDYAIYEEKKLVEFLERLLQEEKMTLSRTVIISCAGMGNRLGLGTTKAIIGSGWKNVDCETSRTTTGRKRCSYCSRISGIFYDRSSVKV